MKKETIHISIDKQVKEQLLKEAKEKGLTLNSYVRMILFERRT